MAKYRHRVFEMYEHRDEAIAALIPKFPDVGKADDAALRQAKFRYLKVSCSSVVTHVQFTGATAYPDEAAAALAEDFDKLVELLNIDSKVLLDFHNVESFGPACVRELVAFDRRLRNRGSRTVICCLVRDARASFFEDR